MTDIWAKPIADSIGPNSPRLMTMLARYPKFIHAEHTRHRSLSFSVSSSRAIPVAKNLEEVRSDELRAAPVWWGREQKGMESGAELLEDEYRIFQFVKDLDGYSTLHKNPLDHAKALWRNAALQAAEAAEILHSIAGAHKSIVNRLLEPFLHVNVLATGTEPGWMNFFGLRLDKAAQPEIRVLAEAMWKVWNESRPTKLEPGQWHLPFIDEETITDVGRQYPRSYLTDNHTQIRVSAARCARLSYTSFATQRRSTIEEDLALYEKLAAARHWSPLEHQATPDEPYVWPIGIVSLPEDRPRMPFYANEHQAGNLGPGWRQLRKMFPDEAVAPLPEEYRR